MSRMDENTEASYIHLSDDERDDIANRKAAGEGTRAIARALGRSPSTISCELKRNASFSPSDAEGVAHSLGAEGAAYYSNAASQMAAERARRPRREWLKNAWLREYVEARLREHWTPKRISGRLERDYGDCYERNLSGETIYVWVYSDDAPADLRAFLPRHHKERGKVDGRGKRAGVGKIPQRVGIEERPAEVENREQPGHWEGDTVIGKQGGAAVHTEVERQTRFMVVRLIPNKTAAETLAAMLSIFGEIPEDLRRTLTLDNGPEFVRHMALHEIIDTYFARAYHSWERGSNENINGYLRRFFPKGTDFNDVTQEQLDYAVNLINNMPRECLNWETAAEAWARLNETHQTGGCCA
jgi:IS30 family transposase